MSIALEAAFVATRAALLAEAGNFGDRVFREMAEAGTDYPYVVVSWAGGGDDNVRKGKKTANVLIQVKCLSMDGQASATGAAQIDTALDDRGYQDTYPTASTPDTAAQALGWRICTITAEDTVFLVEPFENVKRLYHTGKVYRFIMEES